MKNSRLGGPKRITNTVSPHVRVFKICPASLLGQNVQSKIISVYHLPTAINLPLGSCRKGYCLVVCRHLCTMSGQFWTEDNMRRTVFLVELIIIDMALVGSTPSLNLKADDKYLKPRFGTRRLGVIFVYR